MELRRKRRIRTFALALTALLGSAHFCMAPGATIREIKFVYRDPTTGAEAPVDSPSPQWFAQKTKLEVGQPYSADAAREGLQAFITEHNMLCREVRPEPLVDGVRVVFVFEKEPTVWTVKVVARKGTPSIPASELMESAVSLRRDKSLSRAAISADSRRIVDHLREGGYHFATVNAWITPVAGRAGFADVKFEVDRGPKVQPVKITITGNRAFSDRQLQNLMRTTEDRWYTSRRFVQKTYEADVETIKSHYLQRGWEDVQVKPRPVLFDPEFVRVDVDYRRGQGRNVITRVRVSGARTLSSASIRRGLLLRRGGDFSRARLDKDIQWLSARCYAFGLRTTPQQINIRDWDLAGGKRRLSAEITFARAQERVTIEIALKPGPNGKPAVDRIVHRTTGPFTNKQIADLSALRPGDPFTQDAVLADISAITRLYTRPGRRRYALIDAKDTPTAAGRLVQMEFMSRGPADVSAAVYLRIDIEEGGRYRVGSVTFEGVKPLFEDHIRDRLTMKKGSLFTRADLAADTQLIRMVYQEKGYADVKVRFGEAHVARPDQKVYNLKYIVEPGPLYYIDVIRPTGNDKTRPEVIKREMAIKPEDRYDIRKIAQSVRRLRSLRYFNKVEVRAVDSKKTRPGKRYKELHVHVEEASTRQLMIGAGASSSSGFFGDFRFQDSNFDAADRAKSWNDFVSGTAFSGGGQSLAIFLQPGSEASRFGVHFRDPWLRQRPVELDVSAGYSVRNWEEYSVSKLGAGITIGKRFRPDLTGFVGFRAHLADVFDVGKGVADEIADDEGTHVVVGVSTGIRHDTVDDPAFPTQGKRYTVMAELISCPALKLTAEGRGFHTVRESEDKTRHVISVWGNVGVILGSNVPVFERFFAGGLGSVRGFATHGISPRSGGDAIGGRFKLEGGAEYHFPVIKDRVRGVAFLDAGSVAEQTLGFARALADLRISAGVGAHIVIPQLGKIPVAVYVGFPLKKESGDDKEAFSFSVGILLP